MKINDAKQKILDSINNLKQKICDALTSHPDLVSEKKPSVAYDLYKHQDEIKAATGYKQLRDIFVKILEEHKTEPVARKYLNDVLYDYDRKYARDPRVGGYNDIYLFEKLLSFIYNIIMRAENLGSPDVNRRKTFEDACHDNARKLLDSKACKFDDTKLKDVEDNTGEKVFVDIMRKMNSSNNDYFTTIGTSWVKKVEGSKITFLSDVPALMSKDEFIKFVESALPANTKLNLLYVQERESAFEFEFAPLSDKMLYKLIDELDAKFGDIYDIQYDNRRNEITLTIDEDVENLQKVREQIVRVLGPDAADNSTYMNFRIKNPNEQSNKIVFGLIDMETATKEAKFEVIMPDVNIWNEENKNAKQVDLTTYYVTSKGVKQKDSMNKGEEIAKLVAEELKGQCGPTGGENPKLRGNKVGLYSQMPTEWYVFNDDGSVDFENLKELLEKNPDDWGIETDEDKEYMMEHAHMNSVEDLFKSDLSWFVDLDNADELLEKINKILKRKDDSKKSMKDDEDSNLLKLCKLLGEAHDKIMEAQDLVKDLIEAGEVDDSLEYDLDDLEADCSNFEFMGENNPVEALLEKYAPEETDDWDDEDED